MASPDEPTWHLGQVVLPQEGNNIEVNIGRVARDGEVERLHQATLLVSQWFSMAPFSRLLLAHLELQNALQDTPAGVMGPVLGQAQFVRIQSAVLGWLNQFRAFEDHTAHSISAGFGDDSLMLANFKALTAVEYDSNAAYRIVGKFRNYCQHVSDPVRISSRRWVDEVGVTHRALDVFCEPKELLKSKDSWNARVRSDLEAIEGRIEILPLLQSAIASCERVYYALLGEVRSDIEAALGLIESYAVADPLVTVGFLQFDDKLGVTNSDLKLDGVRFDLAADARQILAGRP